MSVSRSFANRKRGRKVDSSLNRRHVLQWGAQAVLNAGVFLTLEKAVKGIPTLAQNAASIANRPQEVRDLFLPAPFDLVPSRHHPLLPTPTITFSNEMRVVQTIKNMLGDAKILCDDIYPAETNNSWICIGSPAANHASRMVLGDTWNGDPHWSYRDATGALIAEFEYSIVAIHDEQVTRLQDGKPHTVPNYAVVRNINGKREIVTKPFCEKGRLISDVLLVTKLPFWLGGPDCVIFAGMHGPATRAVELLLSQIDPADIDLILNCIGDSHKSFQAIFRVEDLAVEEDTTIARRISIDKYASPREVKLFAS